MKRTIYISGPITGLPEQEVRSAFQTAEARLKRAGYETINPLEVVTNQRASYGECMGKDIQELIDNADAVYFCRGWQNSKGCMLEFHTAKIYEKETLFE